MEKLVSILTPCYNGAQYIDRYAKSLLDQDYSNCQLIFMDDGSTDNSKDLIYGYKDKFEQKGFTFEYHWHENKGVGATFAEGIKYVKGVFLIWPDVDDALTAFSISKKVFYLEHRPDVGCVRTKYIRLYDSDESYRKVGPEIEIDATHENIFEDYLLTKDAWFQPGCFMVRMSSFDDANKDRYIYPTRRGQNWQMLLPIFYKYKCAYIDNPLYKYYIHNGSLSDESKDTLDIVLHRYDMYEELIDATVKHMRIQEEQKYLSMVHNHYLEAKMNSALKYKEKSKALSFFKQLNEQNELSFKRKVRFYLAFVPFSEYIFKAYSILRK